MHEAMILVHELWGIHQGRTASFYFLQNPTPPQRGAGRTVQRALQAPRSILSQQSRIIQCNSSMQQGTKPQHLSSTDQQKQIIHWTANWDLRKSPGFQQPSQCWGQLLQTLGT